MLNLRQCTRGLLKVTQIYVAPSSDRTHRKMKFSAFCGTIAAAVITTQGCVRETAEYLLYMFRDVTDDSEGFDLHLKMEGK